MGTTRRDLLRYAGAASATALLVACEPRAKTPRTGDAAADATGDRLLVELADGPAVLSARTGSVVIPAGAGVVTADGRRLIGAGSPGLVVRDTRTGAVVSRVPLRDALVPRVVSTDGRLIALAEPGRTGATPYRPAGRSRTPLVVADESGERYRFDLPGNLEPEAFSADGTLLFVLDYLPPTAPDSYRVRALKLATGALSPLATRLKTVVPPGAEETMRGEGRQAVLDPMRARLYTLYTHQPDHLHTRDLLAGARTGKPDVHAFVHTLSLTEGWAYCVDLPAPFGETAAAGHTIAHAGGRVLVAAAGGGALAAIDAEQLTVGEVARLPVANGTASSALSGDGTRLFVAAGTTVRAVALGDLAPGPAWRSRADVRGVACVAQTLYIGQPSGIVALDAATGRERARISAPGLRSLVRALP